MKPFDLTKFEQLKATGDLPSPKGAALAIMRLMQRPDISLAELAHAIRADPAVSARLIKAANGANGIGRRPIVSIQNALTVLGLPAVRTLVAGFSLLSNYSGGNCENFDYRRYWSHSLLCAIALQALANATASAVLADRILKLNMHRPAANPSFRLFIPLSRCMRAPIVDDAGGFASA